MRQWAILLGGLVVWAAHFFAAYLAASLFPGSDSARWMTGAATLVALAADGAILLSALRLPGGELEAWIRRFGAIGAGLSFVAVLWQGLPALLV